MTDVQWMIRGPEIATCNCSYGCPCQFNALPTNGDCRAAVAMQIEEGFFGEVRLDGLRWAAVAAWPRRWLAPGEAAELYVAVRLPTPERERPDRPSLLGGRP